MATSKTLAALLLLWPCLATAQLLPDLPRASTSRDWSDADTARQTALTLTLYADYAQTRSITRIPGLYEHNPILGPQPSDRRISAYFLTSAVLAYGTARALPAGWPRSGFQYGVIALQVAVILHNRRVGLQFHY